MALVEFDLTTEHLEACPWRQVIETCAVPDCYDYSHALYRRATQPDTSPSDRAALQFLAAITSPLLTPDRPTPFSPAVILPTGRSSLPEDMDARETDLLAWVAEHAADPDLKARAADFAWHLKRDHRLGRLAVDAYFRSAEKLEGVQRWRPASVRITRGVEIAASLGKNGEPFREAFARLEQLAQRSDEHSPDVLTLDLMETLLDYRVQDPQKWATLAAERAQRCEQAKNTNFARMFWRLASKWFARSKDATRARETLLRLAETHVADANLAEGRSVMVAIHHLESAVEAFRRVGDTRDRIRAVRDRIDELRPKMLPELKRTTVSVDTAEMTTAARDHVSGKQFLDALMSLGLGMHPIRKSKLRDQTLSLAKQFPFQALVPTVVMDSSGRPIGRRGGLLGLLSGDPAQDETALEKEMFKNAVFEHSVRAGGVIEPARDVISSEHPCLDRDLMPIVSENPFVPPDRIHLFIRGLSAGLHGDFVAATHILVPQVENALRYVLAMNRVSVTRLVEGIEDVLPLDSLLALPETVAIFGDDAIFELRAVLTERFGSNLRNRVAHGLVSEHEFFGHEGRYLWWLVLHFCCVPIAARRRTATEPSTGPGTDPSNIGGADESG